jgi:hypothetical protein
MSLKIKALDEWCALNHLYNTTKNKDCPIKYIKPIAYIKQINGIVTEKIEGKDLWKILRIKETAHKRKIIYKIGRGIKYLQAVEKKEVQRIDLVQKETGNKKLDKKIKEVIKQYQNQLGFVVMGPDFDIRDIIVNKRKIFLLDPGKLNLESVYQAIATLLVTIKIIHQNSINFLFNKNTKNYEKELLHGYFGNKKYNEKLLNLFILDRLLLHYGWAQRSLNQKKFLIIQPIKLLVKKIYIDRFYFREIRKIINELK